MAVLREPHHLQGGSGRAHQIRAIRVQERKLHVLQGRRPGEQVEALENEPQLPAPNLGQSVFIEKTNLHSIQEHAAGGRAVQAPQEIHERTLSRTRSSHQRHELPLPYLQAHTLQRLDLSSSVLLVCPGQLPGLDQYLLHVFTLLNLPL